MGVRLCFVEFVFSFGFEFEPQSYIIHSVPVLDEDARAWKKLKPKDIEAGAIQLLKALQGNYISQGVSLSQSKEMLANCRMFVA